MSRLGQTNETWKLLLLPKGLLFCLVEEVQKAELLDNTSSEDLSCKCMLRGVGMPNCTSGQVFKAICSV